MYAAHVPLPTGEPGAPPAEVVAGVHRWIGSAPLRDLVFRFGGRWPSGETSELLAWLDDFSAEHWDFRDGRERPDAHEPALDAPTAGAVVAAARALGLVTAQPPPRRPYQHLIVLGGLAHACLQRIGYAAHLLRIGRVRTGEVSVLGSFRELSPFERDLLAAVGLGECGSEVDVLEAGVQRAFGVKIPAQEDSKPDPDPHRAWSVRMYRPAGGPVVRVLAAPSSDPAARRAHTADTQRFWAHHAELAAGERVLSVTAPIYVPFQHCDAVRALAMPYGCGIDTVGVDARLADARLPRQTLTPGRYLQEIRSAIRSMRRLVAAVVG